jgi:activator of HSP90 ATPase
MSYDFELVCDLPASPRAIYEAWLSSAGHSAMTGAKANSSKKVGAAYSAWDGYIVGRNLELEPNRRIVQSWRTSEFAANDPDSTVTIALSPIGAGARLSLKHTGVPDGQTSYENEGWREFYFEPMQAYFARRVT